MSLRLAVIPGDGIGPEVIAEATKVLDAVLPGTQRTTYDVGAARYLRTGEVLPASVLDELGQQDAILLGAVGDPAVPPGVLERGLLLELRFRLDHHVNLRPARSYPGVAATAGDREVDLVVVREGTEGPYVGHGGRLRAGTPHEVATEVSVNTAYGVERVVRDAFRRAAQRRQRLSLVHKTNVLLHAGGLWRDVTQAVAADFPGVAVDYLHVDAAAMLLVTEPDRFDVVVTDNLFGDILTDVAAAVTGGIGLAASGNLDVSRAHPSMFEPVHGSAPDIAGRGTADPTAAVLSVALLLEHLGEESAAEAVHAAVAEDLRSRSGPRPTAEVGDALATGAGRIAAGQ